MPGGQRAFSVPDPRDVAARLQPMAENLVTLIVWRNETKSRRKARAIQRVIDKKAEMYRRQGLGINRDFARLLNERSWDKEVREVQVRKVERTLGCFRYLPLVVGKKGVDT